VSPATQPARHAYGAAAAVALAAAAADQITKAIVRGSIGPGETVELFAGIELVRVANDGIAFGLLDGTGTAVLVLATLAFAGLLAYFLSRGDRAGLWLPVGLIAGGALGNLIDRVREGFVTDFIDLPAWPAFNLADIEITVGVALMMLVILREPDPEPEPGAEAPAEPGAQAR
jgi:signal peptidase II